MSKDTGGAAFPCEQHETQDGRWNDSFEPGMTLRDYFAAKAMMIQWHAFDQGYFESDTPNVDIAKGAYQLADEMLRARGQ